MKLYRRYDGGSVLVMSNKPYCLVKIYIKFGSGNYALLYLKDLDRDSHEVGLCIYPQSGEEREFLISWLRKKNIGKIISKDYSDRTKKKKITTYNLITPPREFMISLAIKRRINLREFLRELSRAGYKTLYGVGHNRYVVK